MSNRSINYSLNYTTPVVLFLVFAILKVAGVLSWSWWWITAPLWGPVGLLLFIFLSFLVLVVLRVLN